MIGIGHRHCEVAVFIGNRPPLDEYLQRESLVPATEGELANIGRETGNHWRKVINIYAKLGFLLYSQGYSTWQDYREKFLLTEGSQQVLLFNGSIVTVPVGCVSIICGKTHAMTLLDKKELQWIDGDFAVVPSRRIVVTPYFDYRQLSNVKLDRLVRIVGSYGIGSGCIEAGR